MKTRSLIFFLICLAMFMLYSCGNLKPQECEHNYSENVVEPTCTAEGYTEHTCSACGDSYRDSETEKTSHTYEDKVVDPTCIAEGYTEHTCSVCGESYRDSETDITAHRFNGAACAFCSKEAITENITPDTEWYNADFLSFNIGTAEELAGLASLVNSGTDFTDQTVYLSDDIDLGYYEWIPIGNAENPFKGNFDGDGHTVSGLKINSNISYVGLFGKTNGYIKDLNVEKASVFVNNISQYVSIVCGYSEKEITNVSVCGFLDADKSEFVGSIVGGTLAQVKSCNSSAIVTGANYVGGIIGKAEVASALFSKIENTGSVTGEDYVGGLIGRLVATGIIQTDCLSSTCEIEGINKVGGAFGYVEGADGSSLCNVSVSSEITGDSYIGGIAGYAVNVVITDCKNEGSTLSSDTYFAEEVVAVVYLGGYVGKGYIVKNCINSIDIDYNSRGAYVGGIAGMLLSDVIACENTGNIKAHNSVGGIVGGINAASALNLNELKNSGNISGGSKVGGIVGVCSVNQASSLSSLDNQGAVQATDNSVGGIIGSYVSTAQFSASNLSNTGNVTSAEHYVGGIVGYISAADTSIIKSSSSSADISGKYAVGGLIGWTENVSLTESSNEGSTVSATGWVIDGNTDYVWLGGYVGRGYVVKECENNVDINYEGTGFYVGGIGGQISSEVSNCTNNASVTSKSSNVGGIAGRFGSYKRVCGYTDLTNNGMIKGKDCVGGITGNMDYVLTVYLNPTISVNKAYNYGNIEGETNVAGIFGRVHLENTCYVDNLFGKDEYGTLLLSNSGDWTNAGSVSCKTSDGGELIGSFWADGYNYSVSTIDNYTVTGKIILNGEEVEADVGSALTKLSLTNRKLVETEDSDSQNGIDNNGTSTQ